MKNRTFSGHSEQNQIDIVEMLADTNDWPFERVSDEQIAMAVSGQWDTYQITMAWSAYDETLRLICTFDLEVTEKYLPPLYELANLINDRCWAGAFNYWVEQQMMLYGYGLILTGGLVAESQQIDTMIGAAIMGTERYYPAIQLVVCGDQAPKDAIETAIAEAYGRA
jgi:hypothetical protein